MTITDFVEGKSPGLQDQRPQKVTRHLLTVITVRQHSKQRGREQANWQAVISGADDSAMADSCRNSKLSL